VNEAWIDALSESTRQRQAHLLGDATVRVELGLQDDTLAAATFTGTAEADANGHEVSTDNGNSNANNTVGTVLDNFHAKMGRLTSLEECNDIRVQNNERPFAPETLRNAISKLKRKDIGTSRTLEALIQVFYAETNSLPTLVQLNDTRIKNGQLELKTFKCTDIRSTDT
jgi:hypothetical protein